MDENLYCIFSLEKWSILLSWVRLWKSCPNLHPRKVWVNIRTHSSPRSLLSEYSPNLPGNWPEGSTQNERGQVMCRTFRSKKFVLKVRHHFHTLEYFIITDHFSAEKMYDEFPFVRWHLLSLERHEPRDSGLFERWGQHSRLEADSVEPSGQLPPGSSVGKCPGMWAGFALKR